MAQKILIRRGGIDNLSATIGVSKGELIYATGSVNGVENVVFIANSDGNNTFTPVNKLYTGTAAANSFNAALNGAPYYKSDTKALYILNSAGSTALDLSGNLEGTTISSITASGSFNGTLTGVGSGSFSGSFVGNGSGLTNISLGSVAAPGNDTELLYNGSGTISATSGLKVSGTTFDATTFDIKTTGDISGSDLKLTGNANIAGNVTIGGSITIGDADTDFINFAGEISSSLVPDADNEFDLGTLDKHWNAVYATHFSGSTGSVLDVETVKTGIISGSNLYISSNATVVSTLTAAAVAATDVTIDSGVGSLKMGPAGSETVIIASNTGNTKIAGTFELTGSADFGSTVRVETGISSSGWIYAAGALDVDGASTLTGNTAVGGTLGVTGDLAVNTNKFTVAASSGNTVIAGTLIATGSVELVSTLDVAGAVTVTNDIDADDITIDGWGSVSASLAAIESGTAALSLDDVTTVGSTTANSIQVGGLTVTGDLTVQGTTTTINSTEVNVGDRIITLNTAGTAADGGIQVIDPVSTSGTGSLLWNATNDYWYAGVSGSTHYRLSTYNSSTPTANNVQKVDANGRLVDSSITDNGSTVVSTLSLTGNGLLDSSSTAAIRFTYINASKQLSYITPTTTGDLIQWNGTAMVASNIIDGGTF